MKPIFKILSFLLVVLLFYSYFHTGLFKEKVKVLDKYNFEKGNWILIKGNSEDTMQRVLTYKNDLSKLKDSWILYKLDEEFGTTGGYVVNLYNDTGRVLSMDIIQGSSWESGKLSDQYLGTLFYNNLYWLNNEKEDWKDAKQFYSKFKTDLQRTNYIDSLKLIKNVFKLYEENKDKTYIIKYIVYDK